MRLPACTLLLSVFLCNTFFCNQASAAERDAFVNATRPTYDKWKSTVGTDLVSMAEKAIAARNK